MKILLELYLVPRQLEILLKMILNVISHKNNHVEHIYSNGKNKYYNIYF
jgi:hypothetical protein